MTEHEHPLRKLKNSRQTQIQQHGHGTLPFAAINGRLLSARRTSQRSCLNDKTTRVSQIRATPTAVGILCLSRMFTLDACSTHTDSGKRHHKAGTATRGRSPQIG